MNKQEQKKLIGAMLEGLEESITKNIDKIPDNWDGYELRQYLADKANEYKWMEMDGKRMAEYKNDVIVNNL